MQVCKSPFPMATYNYYQITWLFPGNVSGNYKEIMDMQNEGLLYIAMMEHGDNVCKYFLAGQIQCYIQPIIYTIYFFQLVKCVTNGVRRGKIYESVCEKIIQYMSYDREKVVSVSRCWVSVRVSKCPSTA